MALKIGIIGLPNVGKSTLFNALTESKGAEAANYPFCTIDPNVGVVEVPDARLSKLADIVHPEKVIPASVEFVDIAGLVEGAHKGEGLGNKFLGAIREVHALCHVVRCFENGDITHVSGSVDPARDREVIETELALSDLQSVTSRLEKVAGPAKTGDKEKIAEKALLEKIHGALEEGKKAGEIPMTEDEEKIVKDFGLLTKKPILYATNVDESYLSEAEVHEPRLRESLGLSADQEVVPICAKLEEDLQDLSPEETAAYLEDLGLSSSGLDRLISAAYKALGYITYFTAGPKEVRAWTITDGFTAPQAAGVIHTDFEKGFIRAETIAYEDYIAGNGEQGAKEAGKMRSEGKDYVVKDGDVMLFRFNT